VNDTFFVEIYIYVISPMKDKIIDKITTFIAYALLPITYPLHMWRHRDKKKSKK